MSHHQCHIKGRNTCVRISVKHMCPYICALTCVSLYACPHM
jgi:hypothetical protein